MDKKMKLNDDNLDNVSGGTIEENFELMRAFNIDGTHIDTDLLEEKLLSIGIDATVSNRCDNYYIDKKTDEKLTHAQVLARIKKK